MPNHVHGIILIVGMTHASPLRPKTAQIRHNIELDEFIIMPNRVHGIITITNVGAHCNVPLHRINSMPQIEQFGKSTHNSIPTIIKLFKSTVTIQINQLRNTLG